MIKANAYGIDAIRLAPYLIQFGVKLLGVSHVNEGIALRHAGIDFPIFVVSAPPFEADKVAKYHLQPAVSSREEIEALNNAAKEVIPVHLHVNTGMNRFGVVPEEALHLFEAIHKAPRLVLEGVMTHFTSADIPELDSKTYKQITLFKSIVNTLDPLPRWVHAANSQAAVRFSLPFCNLVRIGIALFESALTLESHLCFIRTPKLHETVGYHGTHKIQHPHMRMGVVPFGYYDGLHRHYKEKGYVLIHGKRAPMIGNICMDFMMIDLTEIPEAHIGDPITIFNENLPPKTVACWGNTDIRELLVNIGPRTQRNFINDEQENLQPCAVGN